MKKYTLIQRAILGGIVILFLALAEKSKAPSPSIVIASFKDCALAGYLIMESYPRQCKAPNGKIYTEELATPSITYDHASSDLIVVDTPTPGAVTGKKFSIVGKARGTWYFEASFPVFIKDTKGKTLAVGHGQALTDWMTTEFVNFRADIVIPETFTGKAFIVLAKDNPSALPENEASVTIPITIEY